MDDDSSLKLIVKGAGIVILGMFFSKLINYIYKIIVARGLGPEQYGILSIGQSILGIIGFISLLGFEQGVERFVGFFNNKERVNGIVNTAFYVVIPFSLILSFLVFFFSDYIAISFFKNSSLTRIIQVYALIIPFYALSEILFAVCRGIKRIDYQFYFRDIGEGAFKLVITVVLIFFGFGVFGASLAHLFAVIISVFSITFMLRKKNILDKFFKSKLEPALFSFSLPLLFASAFFILTKWVDTVMLGYFKTEVEVGIYNAAASLANLIPTFALAFNGLLISVLSGLLHDHKTEEIRHIFNRITAWNFYLTAPIVVVFFFFPSQIIGLFFGDVYVAGAFSFVLLTIGYFFSVLLGPTGQMINIIGKTKLNLLTWLVGLISNIIFNYLLIPKYGIVGAAMGTMLSLLILKIVSWVCVYNYISVNPYNKGFFKSLFAVLLASIILYISSRYISMSLIFVIISSVIFSAVYFFLLLLFKVPDQTDLKMIETVENKLKIKIISRIIRRFI